MRTIVPQLFALSLSSLGCGSSRETATDGATFACPSDGTLRCAYNTQYCLLTVQGGSTVPSCVDVPAGCTGAGSPCPCLSATYDGGTSSCVSFNANNLRATTVTLAR
jgi:hypothetical protein